MSEIPEDVLQAAREVAKEWRRVDWNSYEGDFEADLSEDIARAILAERERCAVVAESRYTEESTIKSKAGKTFASGRVAIYAAQNIAAAIRLPSPPSKEGE